MTDFVHLHVHTEYSLLDGACRIPKLVEAAKNLGQTAIAITDHGVMYGAIDFYKKAKEMGVKPIIGCEVYVAARTRYDRLHEYDREHSHLILLCENNEGYQNLIKIVSSAFIDGFYGKPRVDHDLLEQHSRGLICLSACLAGEIPRALMRNDYEKAKEIAGYYADLFGKDHFYVEIQDHGIEEQQKILPDLVRLAAELELPLVATNDVHYIEKRDSKMQNVLLCIQMNKTINDKNDIEFPTQEFYLKSGEEMERLFSQYPQALENSVKIAQRCNVEFQFGKTQLPYFQAPDGKENIAYFEELCFSGLKRKYGENPSEEVRSRLAYEIDVIKKMGYVDYFLIVFDFVNYARQHDIPVGPGRGSGVGSVAAYCMGITEVEPLKYGLIFERFLNPERISMPDFDIDFCYEKRQLVIDYVVSKYGSDHVAQIITFGTLAARAAVRDVGRALGMSYAEVDTIAKLIPFELHMTIEKALQVSTELRQMYQTGGNVKDLIDMASEIEGMPRHASTHAAGVVITRQPVECYVPLAKNDEAVITQFTMTTLEELGLLKMDFLGLRNLTVIDDAVKLIRKDASDFDIQSIPFDDQATYEMLSKGQTDGVFQLESTGIRQVLMRLKPEGMEDLIAVISLYRPGPMESIPRYIENRHHPEKTTFKHPLLKEILNVTYGCIVYQEQVMQIVRSLAGYSYGMADLVRRAMAKKKHEVMEKERDRFINGFVDEVGNVVCPGCVRNGISAELANEIFDEMASFASYAFNKSHSAAYAYVAYRTAYLKCHYPKQYLGALLTSVLGNASKITVYIEECKRYQIKVLPPDINLSAEGFTVSGDDIRFGLLAVKNLGKQFIADLEKERSENGRFSSFFDFCKRMFPHDLNKRALEGLIKCGCFDCFGNTRKQLYENYQSVLDDIENTYRRNLDGQMNLFGAGTKNSEAHYKMSETAEFPLTQLLGMEKEVLGLFVSGHPLNDYQDVIQAVQPAKIAEILSSGEQETAPLYQDGVHVVLVGLITAIKRKTTKSDQLMAFVTLEDLYGGIECLVFPAIYMKFSDCVQEGSVVLVKGRVSLKEEEAPKIVCDEIYPPKAVVPLVKQKSPDSRPSRPGLYLRVPSMESKEFVRIRKVLEVFDGSTPVYIFEQDSGKLILTPKSLWVYVNDVLVRELEKRLGEKNVALKD